MGSQAVTDVLLEAVAQTEASYPGTDQAGGENARSHTFGPIAQKLLAAIEDNGNQQWVEQRAFQRDRSRFRAGAMVQDSSSGYGPIGT
jgi:hypothetical protein